MQKNTKQNMEYLHKGVAISPAAPAVGERITILYDGILSKNGASGMTVHLGYGTRWDNAQDVPMVKGGTCFEATVPAIKEDSMKLSFSDPQNNIDDNSGNGYSFDITG